MTKSSTQLRSIGYQPVETLAAPFSPGGDRVGDIIEVVEPNGSTRLRTVYGATIQNDLVIVDLKTRRQVFNRSDDVLVFVEDNR